MIEAPKNYEEAKLILKNSSNDELHQRNMKIMKLRFGLVTSIAAAAAVGIGLISKNVTLSLGFLPIAALGSLSMLIPILAQKKAKHDIESGKYFEDRSEEEIMRIATGYTEQYNDYKRSR